MNEPLPMFLPIRKRGPVASLRLALPNRPGDAPIAVEASSPPPVILNSLDDTSLLAILESPLKPGETAVAGYARKERDLAMTFARLSLAGSVAMRKRLATPASNDQLATKFARLTVERRTRLLQFLADAGRRAALALPLPSQGDHP